MSLEDKINEFIANYELAMNNPVIARVAAAIADSIPEVLEDEYQTNAFSVNVEFDGSNFIAQSSFNEDYAKIIMYYENTDNEAIERIKSLDSDELMHIAYILIDQNWIEGYNANS